MDAACSCRTKTVSFRPKGNLSGGRAAPHSRHDAAAEQSSAASYERLGNHDVPKDVGWSSIGRGQLVRLPMPRGNSARMELRSPDNLCNPYLAYALVMAAGLDGIERAWRSARRIARRGFPCRIPCSRLPCWPANRRSSKTVLPEGTLRAYLAMGLR